MVHKRQLNCWCGGCGNKRSCAIRRCDYRGNTDDCRCFQKPTCRCRQLADRPRTLGRSFFHLRGWLPKRTPRRHQLSQRLRQRSLECLLHWRLRCSTLRERHLSCCQRPRHIEQRPCSRRGQKQSCLPRWTTTNNRRHWPSKLQWSSRKRWTRLCLSLFRRERFI